MGTYTTDCLVPTCDIILLWELDIITVIWNVVETCAKLESISLLNSYTIKIIIILIYL